MKVVERVLDVDSTLQGDKITMSLDPGAVAHIIGILTDLYSDPELAVIREYCTNALDAHIEAGLIGANPRHSATLKNIDRLERELGMSDTTFVNRPIEVTLPSKLSPFFKVRDYGFGLNGEDIAEIYSRYGASTKRESDDVVGMLGLGCKSALTYCDQFTLTGIKDGVCTQVSVSRDEDGGGSMTIVDHYQTDEPSGVEIIVPVERFNNFEEKAAEFFRFWDEGTVLVNGEAPKRIDGVWIADDILLTKEVRQAHIVMGNVAYPVKEGLAGQRFNGYQTVAFVKIGDVHFTPSRESLQMDNATKAMIKSLETRVRIERDVALLKMINEAKNRPEAIVLAGKAREIGLNAKPTWRGHEVPEVVEIPKVDLIKNPKAKQPQPMMIVEAKKRWRRKGWETSSRLITTLFPRTIWITGYDSDSFSPFKRQKMEQWMGEKGIVASELRRGNESVEGVEYVVFVDKLPKGKEWISSSTVYPWSEIKAQKIVRENVKPRGDGRPTGSYEGIVDGNFCSVLLAQDIDTSKPLFYRSKWESSTKEIYAIHPDATVVTLGNNRINKFKRDFPMAKHMPEYVREYTKTWWEEEVTEEEKLYLSLKNNGTSRDLVRLDPNRIDSQELRRMIDLVKSNRVDLQGKYNSLRNVLAGLGSGYGTHKDPLDDYPLLTATLRYDTIQGTIEEHAYLYINAVYSAGQEKS